jgi:hypothetical protein
MLSHCCCYNSYSFFSYLHICSPFHFVQHNWVKNVYLHTYTHNGVFPACMNEWTKEMRKKIK